MFRILWLTGLLFLTACAGNDFDEAAVPDDQLATELAYKRLKNHGGLEPVLEVDQSLRDWQFHVASRNSSATMGEEAVVTYGLRDRSGITYEVNSATTSAAIIDRLGVGTYGFGSGVVVGMNRDLVEAKIDATLRLDSWRERED